MCRVVVTGMGVVAPNGTDVKTYWASLVNGVPSVRRITGFDVSGYSTQMAGEVKDFDPSGCIDFKKLKRMPRFAQFALYAAKMACIEAGLTIDMIAENSERMGCSIGVSVNGIKSIEEQASILSRKGPACISPFLPSLAIPHGASTHISVEFRLKGRSTTISTGCSSGLNAIGYAYECIKMGKCDVMFAGGAESPITPLVLGGFCSAGSLSKRNDRPETASRPFDRNRDGYVIGEGAGVLVLESIESAMRRKVRALAEVIGYDSTSDAYSAFKVEPDGGSAVRCFSQACKEAGLEPDDVDYVNAHGSSSQVSDARETNVIKKCLGQHSRKVMVSSIKSMIGHAFGAAGALQTVASIKAMLDGLVPPTINYEERDNACDLDYVPNEARKEKVEVSVVDSLGMGGNNAVLVLRGMRV